MNSHSRPQVPRQCMHACMPPGSRPKARKIRRGGYFKKKADRITHLSIELGACAVLALRREATYWSPSNLLGPIVVERSDGPSQEIRDDMLRLVSRYRTGTADGLLGRRALQGSPSIKERSEGVSKGLSHARLGRTRLALLCLWDMIDRGGSVSCGDWREIRVPDQPSPSGTPTWLTWRCCDWCGCPQLCMQNRTEDAEDEQMV